MNTPTNHAQLFQEALFKAIKEASMNEVHPASVYCILGIAQHDVMEAIKKSSQMAAEEAAKASKTDGN